MATIQKYTFGEGEISYSDDGITYTSLGQPSECIWEVELETEILRTCVEITSSEFIMRLTNEVSIIQDSRLRFSLRDIQSVLYDWFILPHPKLCWIKYEGNAFISIADPVTITGPVILKPDGGRILHWGSWHLFPFVAQFRQYNDDYISVTVG